MSDQAPTDHPALLALHREKVRPEWIDYNGHMNVAFYVLAFDHATDTFLDHVGLGHAYREAAKASTFVVEAHVTYQNEVGVGVEICFATRLMGFDAKRLHLFHYMLKADDRTVLATTELMLLHIDMTSRRTAPMPAVAEKKLTEIEKAQAQMPTPKEAGRVIGIKKGG
jgi:acyl-CoA thioester hydrolase